MEDCRNGVKVVERAETATLFLEWEDAIANFLNAKVHAYPERWLSA